MWHEGRIQGPGIENSSPLIKEGGTDAENSAFVHILKKGQVSTGRSKVGRVLTGACSLGSPQGCTSGGRP